MASFQTVFAIEGSSLVDLTPDQRIPNFDRPTPVNIQRIINNGVRIDPVPAYRPAFFADDSSILIEKATVPLLDWNLDLTKFWLRGDFVTIYSDLAPAPDGSPHGDIVSWGRGEGNSQVIQRTVALVAGQTYTLSFLLCIPEKGGKFSTTDKIRIVGDVKNPPPIELSDLNDYQGKYRLLTTTFVAGGRQPILPSTTSTGTGGSRGGNSPSGLRITGIANNTVTVEALSIRQDDLIGGQISFEGIAGQFNITANTATNASGQVTITVNTPSVAALGVTTTATAKLLGAAQQNCTIQIYSESAITVYFGGCQLETGEYPTSVIYNRGVLNTRSATTIFYRSSPIRNLSTFGFYLELRYWYGDGNIVNCGNFSISITGGKLVVTAGANSVTIDEALPRENAKIFVQVAVETTSMLVYVEGKLKAKTNVVGFKGQKSGMDLTTDGVRAIRRFFIFSNFLSDGQVELNQKAGLDVGELFSQPNTVISTDIIAAHSPIIKLPTTIVPSVTPPDAATTILSVNSGTRVVGVLSSANFAIADNVLVLRKDFQITWAIVQAISGNNITLDNVAGITINDNLIKGNVNQAGRASVRLPFTIATSQEILTINPGARSLTAGTTLSYVVGRAFVQDKNGQDVREVLITSIDNTNKTLSLNSIEGILAGHLIIQPEDEMELSPYCYHVDFLRQLSGLRLANKGRNAIVISNTGNTPIEVDPLIIVAL